jgi:spore coat protein U-like protein
MKKSNKTKTTMKTLLGGALIAGIALVAAPAHAGTATSDMLVSMNVGNSCTISAGTLAFGAYDPVTTNATLPLNGTATLAVNCTNGSTATITLGQGSNADVASTDTAPLRRAVFGTSNYLTYSLFTDSERVTPWGNSAGTGAEYTGTGASTNVTVYGSVPAGQNVPSGSYSDTVVTTITF